MRVLVVGGSGYVAGLVLPLMPDRFTFRIFDRNPPAWTEIENRKSKIENAVLGDVTDPSALLAAAEDMDALLYMAMGQWEHGAENTTAAYDVNVKGLHLALDAAVQAGIKRAVYTSSLSVYDGQLDIRSGATDSEDIYPRSTRIYGFTKWLGEEVCAWFNRTHSLPIVALRLFHPVSVQAWHTQRLTPNDPTTQQPYCHTAAPDLARAIAAALEFEHTSFEAIHITGDTSGRAYRHEKATRLLNWEPLEGKQE